MCVFRASGVAASRVARRKDARAPYIASCQRDRSLVLGGESARFNAGWLGWFIRGGLFCPARNLAMLLAHRSGICAFVSVAAEKPGYRAMTSLRGGPTTRSTGPPPAALRARRAAGYSNLVPLGRAV